MDNPARSIVCDEEAAVLVASPTVTVTSSIAQLPQQLASHRHEEIDSRSGSPEGDNISISSSSSGGFSCVRFLKRKLPIIKWLPKYQPRSDLLPDAIAGVTVGLTAIPQSIAYAVVAGLTPEYGLYSNFIPSFVYLFLGSCRQVTIGPTALVELLVYQTCGSNFPSCVILVGFWVGCLQLLLGLLQLGAVVSLISDPVTIGFVGGAALTICASQIRNFLGLSGPKGRGFIGVVRSAIENIGTAKLGDSLLGLGCVIVLLFCKHLKEYVKPDTNRPWGRFVAKTVWYLALGRNAMVVIFASVLAACLLGSPFELTGIVKSGLPPVAVPSFDLPSHFPPNPFNSTEVLTFWETWNALGTAPATIALISILQNVAIAKAFGSGQSIDATQEMIALGVSHLCGSFFSAMPTAGSFTRSAVNEASGVRSPVGGIFTGLLVIFALSFLTRWFAYIPKASLAAVILCAVLPMIEIDSLAPMWRVSKLDVLTTFVTFLASLLLGMEYGILIGVGVSLTIYLRGSVKPRVSWKLLMVEGISEGRYHFLKPELGFQFPSVDYLRTLINRVALQNPEVKLIALDCGRVTAMDYTSASALATLIKALRKTGRELVLIKCKGEWGDMLAKVGLSKMERFSDLRELETWIRGQSETERTHNILS